LFHKYLDHQACLYNSVLNPIIHSSPRYLKQINLILKEVLQQGLKLELLLSIFKTSKYLLIYIYNVSTSVLDFIIYLVFTVATENYRYNYI